MQNSLKTVGGFAMGTIHESPEWITTLNTSTNASFDTALTTFNTFEDTPTPHPPPTPRIPYSLPSIPSPASTFLHGIYMPEIESLLQHPRQGFSDKMVEIHTLSLRQFVAICLLGQHTKSHTEPFLRFDPILSPTATGPGCPTASRFRVILKDSFVLSGIELVAHADEYGPTDARKRNKKTCVFGCLERVSVQPGVEKMVRQACV